MRRESGALLELSTKEGNDAILLLSISRRKRRKIFYSPFFMREREEDLNSWAMGSLRVILID